MKIHKPTFYPERKRKFHMHKRLIRAGATLATLLILILSCSLIQKNHENDQVALEEENADVSIEENQLPNTALGYDVHNDIHTIAGLTILPEYTNQTGEESKGIRYINNTSVNIRSFPTLTGDIIDQLNTNTEVELLAILPTGFCQIKYDDTVAFVHRDYISETKIEIPSQSKPAPQPAIRFEHIANIQERVVAIAVNNQGTKPCTAGWCAAWVSGVYQAAGLGYPGGNAIDYWTRWSSSGSTDMENIPVGAVVVGSGSGSASGNKYGHVGIYIGDGMVVDNPGYHRTISLNEWIAKQIGTCNGYHGYIGWVWPYGESLQNQ